MEANNILSSMILVAQVGVVNKMIKRKLLPWWTLLCGKNASTERIIHCSEQNKRVDTTTSETDVISRFCHFDCLMHPTLTMH